MGSENISLESIKNESTRVQTSAARDEEDYGQDGAFVAAKYMGTITDQREMSMLGRAQVLRVRILHNELLGRHLLTMCRGIFSSYPSWVSVAHLLAPGNSF